MTQDRMESGGHKPRPINLARTPDISNTISSANKILEKVRVVHGANEGYFDLSGQTVGQTKKALRDVFNIPTEAEASVGGKLVGDDYILESGQNLEFVKDAGTKGGHAWFCRRHLAQILEIENVAFPNPWSEEDFLSCLRRKECVGLVYEEKEKEIVAVRGFTIYENIGCGIHLLNFAVDPLYHRQGYGTAIINTLKTKLTKQQKNSITLEVRETNMTAQSFFKKNGFLATKVLRNHYGKNSEDAYFMGYYVEPNLSPEHPYNPKNRISEYINYEQ